MSGMICTRIATRLEANFLQDGSKAFYDVWFGDNATNIKAASGRIEAIKIFIGQVQMDRIQKEQFRPSSLETHL